MYTYFNMLSGLSMIMFYVSIAGLLYALIRKKRKLPWIATLFGAILVIFAIVSFSDPILDRLEPPTDKIEDVSDDPAGTVRVKPGKYIAGKEIPEGLYDISFQEDSGSFSVINLYEKGDFSDYTAFGKNPQFRLDIKNGDGINIKSGIAIFTPSTIEKYSYEEVAITAGLWIVGETVAPGKYRIAEVKNPGFMSVTNKMGQSTFSEVINSGSIIELKLNDVIRLTGTGVKLIPKN